MKMIYIHKILIIIAIVLFNLEAASSQADSTFRIFQFPADKIPRIDGNTDDWKIVPDDYIIGADRLTDTQRKRILDTNNINIKVRVGWVEGMECLYFLCEIYDDYWHFERTDLHHDIFELVVDGDQSGGPLIEEFHPIPSLKNTMEGYFSYHGVHSQNYHIYIPAEGQDWTLAWGCQPWIKELPFANAAYSYDFKNGESGKLILEFWITPFDYAGAEGPARAIKSILSEGKNVGICWALIDYDEKRSSGFWNLSAVHEMYGDASFLKPFKLMPLEEKFVKKIEAKWAFQVIDMSRKVVSFQDKSSGRIVSWKWDFGDGESSDEQHPFHTYKAAGKYIVTLTVQGPDGQSRLAKVWDVALK